MRLYSILMAGTSPAQVGNSPSYHSSSYLPKMEANFMKDFTCCGLTLASLHDLLQHFEETHANVPASRTSQSNQGGMPPTTGASAAGVCANPTQAQGEPAMNTQHGFQTGRQGSVGGGGFRSSRLGSDGFNRTNLSTVQDSDTIDMEMDDVGTGMDGLAPIEESPSPFTSQQHSQFNQHQGPLQPLNVNLANMHQHQGLRTSTPTTPATSQQYNLQHNPTVSSVNTPTLGTVPMQNLTSPESSHPGTPAELDLDFVNGFGMGMNGMNGLNGINGLPNMDMNFGNMNFGNGMSNGMAGFDGTGTIDQPGKRLFSKQGGGLTQAQLQAAYNNFQKMGTAGDGDLAKRIREQQMLAGANIPQLPFQEEVKPFRCPVIGCEKAYKNQNGLKYHKQVSSDNSAVLQGPTNFGLARSPEPTIEGERGWHLLHRRSFDLHTISWYRRYGEGEAVSVRSVRQALQELERPQVPPCSRATLQPGTPNQQAGQSSADEYERQRRRRWYAGHGRNYVLSGHFPRLELYSSRTIHGFSHLVSTRIIPTG